jgi:flagellar biosynthesis component FlhA
MEKLRVQIILEVLGRPKEHVKSALVALVEKIGTEKSMKILEKTIHEPVPIKDFKGMFTTFAEVLLHIDSLQELIKLMFSYMPSHIEVINPEVIQLKNSDLNDLVNKLVSRLHEYDAIAKKVLADREILLRKVAEVAPQLFKEEALPIIQEGTSKNILKPSPKASVKKAKAKKAKSKKKKK